MWVIKFKRYGREEEGYVYDYEAEALEEYKYYSENASVLSLDYVRLLAYGEVVQEWYWTDEVGK